MTQIERRQARIRRIRERLSATQAQGPKPPNALSTAGPLSNIPSSEASYADAENRYSIGKTQNHPLDLFPFLRENGHDPAAKVSPVTVITLTPGYHSVSC